MRDLVFEGKIDSEVEKLSVGMGISLSIGAVDNVSYLWFLSTSALKELRKV